MRFDQVILYSGGMDSFILAALYPNALRLYVDVGSKYAEKEKRHLPRGVRIDSHIHLGDWERDDAIIPGRNLFLALVAAQWGNHIMLGATAGDNSRDKDPTWAGKAQDLMRYMFSGPHFPPTWDVLLSLPIKNKTKAELVHDYIGNGGSTRALLDTVSCYHPTEIHCGHCKSCLRKWVALAHNGVDGTDWASPPWKLQNWNPIIPKLLSPEGWRSKKEDDQTIDVLRQHNLLPEGWGAPA